MSHSHRGGPKSITSNRWEQAAKRILHWWESGGINSRHTALPPPPPPPPRLSSRAIISLSAGEASAG